MKIAVSKSTRDMARLVIQSAAVLVFAFWAVKSFTSGFGLEDSYEGLVRTGTVLFAVVVLVSALVYLPNKRRSRLLTVMAWAVTALAGITLSPWLFGGIQDLLHVRCAGFWGVQWSCIDGWSVAIAGLLHPFVFLPLVVMLPTLLLMGVWQAQRSPR
jgi:hypothetical protein